MFLSLGRTLKEGMKSLLRNGWLSIATVSILILSLYVVSVMYVAMRTADGILSDVQEKINVSVYFKPTVSEENIFKAKNNLQKNAMVKSVEYVSRDTALDNFKRDNADEPVILQSLEEIGENPLLASLVVKAYNVNQYQNIADSINNASYKDEVSRINYGRNKEMIDQLNNVVATIRKVGISLGIIFAVISILVTFNTIRITIYAQRREIEIMRLVGASNAFIRLPFVFEGVLYGLVASIVAMILLYVTLKTIPSVIIMPSGFFFTGVNDVLVFYAQNFWKIFGTELIFGFALGVFSSLIAMRKYLKV
jgi:cell division transport system permease protein